PATNRPRPSSKQRVPMRRASAGIISNVTFSTKAAASTVTFIPDGSGAKGFFSAIGNQLCRIVLDALADYFRNIIVDKPPVHVRPRFYSSHRFTFFFGMDLYRSERRSHDLNFGGAHEVETETAELVQVPGHHGAAVAAQEHGDFVAESGRDFVTQLFVADQHRRVVDRRAAVETDAAVGYHFDLLAGGGDGDQFIGVVVQNALHVRARFVDRGMHGGFAIGYPMA